MLKPLSVSISASSAKPHSFLEDFSNRCVSMSSMAKNSSQIWPNRSNYVTYHRSVFPSFSGMVAESRNAAEFVAAPTSVPVRVAHELLQAGHHYLDVRTPEEFSAGHVAGAVNVPFLLQLGQGMTSNPDFLEQVLAHFGKDDEIIVGCQLGKRSRMAASGLASSGFSGITDMAGGYAAWMQNGLPIDS